VSEGPDDGAGASQAAPETHSVDARGGTGIQVGAGNTQVNNYVYRARRSLTGLIALLVIGLALLPAGANAAAGVLPGAWRPYLWLAWPAEVFLAGTLVYGEMRDRRERRLLPEDADEQRRRLGRARNDLARAVWDQWTAEAGLRSLHSPQPIWVRWHSTGRPAGADLSQVLAEDWVPGRPSQVRGDIRHLLEVFRNVRAGQLVVLGEPAAGKSVMALSLTLGLLPDQPRDLLPDELLPVLLTASSWNPYKEDLHGWLARRIVEEYPALANAEVYGPDAAARLIASRRLVPVLDGLDEMSAELRPTAIRAIDRAASNQYPLVMTCRSAEYLNAVEANRRLLPHAAVLEIQPLGIDDATEFLRGADSRPERWSPVLSHMRAHPSGPLAQALSSPLMVDLARTIYATSTEDPAELLDTGLFPGRTDVEQHLLDAFLLVAYENRPAPSGSRPGPPAPRYPAERAGRWLRFLASHPKTVDAGHPGAPGTDLAWWQLIHSVPRRAGGVAAGLGTGLVSGLAMGLALGPVVGLAYAVTFGPALGFAYACGHPRKPSRIQVRFRGHGRSLLLRLAASLAAGLVTGHLISGIVVMAALAAQLWLGAPPDTATASSPGDVLRHDRGAALTLGAVLWLVISPSTSAGFMAGSAVATIPLTGQAVTGVIAVSNGVISSGVVGGILGGFLYGRAGAIAFGIASAAISVPIAISLPILGVSYGKIMPSQPGLAAGILFGLLIGLIAVMSRAWGTFTCARAWHGMRGNLPWRTMRFLDDAHRRGVLRQAGTVYQFRHEHLQNHLAASRPHRTAKGRRCGVALPDLAPGAIRPLRDPGAAGEDDD